MNIKFLFPLLGLVGGIIIADQFPGALWIAPVSAAISILIWLWITLVSKDPMKGLRIKKWHALWISLLFLSIGNLDYLLNAVPYPDEDISGKDFRIKGRIMEVNYFTEGDRFKVNVMSLQELHQRSLSSGEETVFVTGESIPCKNLHMLLQTDGFSGAVGDVITFDARPNSFSTDDYKERMKHRGISYSVRARTDNIIPNISSKMGTDENSAERVKGIRLSFTDILMKFHQWREQISILIEKSSLNRETSEFLISILLGDKSLLKEDHRTSLTSAGLAHVLALSGMHVAIVFTLFSLLFYPLIFFHKRTWTKGLALICIWLYVFFTGASPSTVRAAIMLSFVVLAFILQRKNSAFNALLAATFLILLFSPLSLWNIGLQLSFLCVAAIILFVNKFNPIDQHLHPLSHSFVNGVLISVVATFATWALIAYYFNQVPLLFLPSNLILLPFLPIFVGAGFLYIFLLSLGIDFTILAHFLDGFLILFTGASDFLSISGRSLISINLSYWAIILWIAALSAFGIAIYTSYRKVKYFAMIASAVLIILSVSSIIFYNPEDNSSIKFVHNFNKLEARLNLPEGSNTLNFPRQTVSHSQYSNFHILSIDCPLNNEALADIKKYDYPENSYLLIGNQADLDQIASLVCARKFKRIVLHSGFGKNKIEELLELLDPSYWPILHSLRQNGSLTLPLE